MTLIPDLERDLVAAAGRRRSVRRRTRRAAGLGAAVAAAAAIALITLWSSDEDPGPKGAAGDQRPATPAPPRTSPPEPGTLVRLGSFDFRGVHYRLSGYRSRGDVVCVRKEQSGLESIPTPLLGITCAGRQSLRRNLRGMRVVYVGGGGGDPIVVSGFTRPDVRGVEVVGTEWPARVVLTRPWRPWHDVRIRAYTIVVDPPPGVDVPRTAYTRIHAVETDR